ncbi:hypothetical protein QN277_017746 [Acacia crassicarpa]|uniref:Chaperone DnaJ-domain superfamily protein n=1 Tax=Acacia crassicarpa TaxID=499986 RepID=A0AAE1JUS3_9FABA|nr:hypothetical protein QN277_017746 [Acacia crassicarpa]
MAMSSTTATVSIAGNNVHPTQAPKFGFSNFVSFSVKPRRFCIRRSTANDSSSTDTTATPTDSETAIEVPEESSSLISALNVERALRGIPITDVDHYGRLGIPRGCSFEKVALAYNNKVEELKKEGLEEDGLNKKLEHLKESYSILSSKQERRIYDWSLARTENTEQYVWPFEVDITQTTQDTPPPQEPEDEGPTRVVGYFLLGWVLISFLLSIALS